MKRRFSYSQILETFQKIQETTRPAWLNYFLALAPQFIFFALSLILEGESRVIFTLYYLVAAVLASTFCGTRAGLMAGAFASFSIDYHYVGTAQAGWMTGERFLYWALASSILFLIHFLVSLQRAATTHAIHLLRIAEEATRAREDLLATVAHDLRQPLSTAVLQSHVLVSSLESGNLPMVSKTSENISKALQKMDRMIADLLDAEKLRVGTFSLRNQPTSIEVVAAQSVQDLSPQALAKGVKLQLKELKLNIPIIAADSDLLQRVFANLIGNALKFTPKGGSIDVEVGLPDQETIEVSVRDTGSGIPEKDLSRVFERNWQAKSNSESTSVGGVGLGLYISKKIIEAHQGKIWCESGRGEGAVFYFRIPVKKMDYSVSPRN